MTNGSNGSNGPAFSGSAEQRALAEEVFRLMSMQGRFFAADAPIRQTLTNLAEFFAAQRKADPAVVAQEIDAALRANEAVFTREERDGDVVYITSRLGSYRPREEDTKHMFRQRLHEPENPLPVDDISVVVTTTRPALTTIEPVFISDYWQQQAGLKPMPSTDGDGEAPAEEAEAAEAVATVDLTAEDVVVAAPEEQAEEAPAELQPAQTPINTVITLPNGVQIDLRRSVEELMGQYGNTLQNLLRSAIESDPLRRIVTFGNQAYPEAAVVNFGKNDLRRIRDYLLEVGEPLPDTQIIADVFYHNPRQADYESFRFALNYRLSREKDFEFVGVEGARLWSTRGLAPIGTKRVKANEMGNLTGYLEEGFDDSLRDQSIESIRKSGSLSHILTFFEWEYGMLPFTRALAALLPSTLLHDQRTAVLRFEFPQHYTSFLAELRYPTGNRGGWVQGLEVPFHEYLVSGALITISRTDDPHVFSITYEEAPETEDRLLVLDESKKTPKFAFANLTYACMVDTDMLVNQQQYGRLRNLKAFPMNERRKGVEMLEHVAETIGTPVGTRAEPRYRVTEQELFVGLNVLRPASREYLAHLLREGERFEPDEENEATWFFTPEPEDVADEVDEDEDDDYYDDEDE
ncbi:MAG: hypothetical protein DIU80_010875 [Chloroflexota bacterium]|nr:MAG: hypothetical protein DIU80_02045 [Chloroflexota bacterium]